LVPIYQTTQNTFIFTIKTEARLLWFAQINTTLEQQIWLLAKQKGSALALVLDQAIYA
jgi:hypothetical protein